MLRVIRSALLTLAALAAFTLPAAAGSTYNCSLGQPHTDKACMLEVLTRGTGHQLTFAEHPTIQGLPLMVVTINSAKDRWPRIPVFSSVESLGDPALIASKITAAHPDIGYMPRNSYFNVKEVRTVLPPGGARIILVKGESAIDQYGYNGLKLKHGDEVWMAWGVLTQ